MLKSNSFLIPTVIKMKAIDYREVIKILHVTIKRFLIHTVIKMKATDYRAVIKVYMLHCLPLGVQLLLGMTQCCTA